MKYLRLTSHRHQRKLKERQVRRISCNWSLRNWRIKDQTFRNRLWTWRANLLPIGPHMLRARQVRASSLVVRVTSIAIVKAITMVSNGKMLHLQQVSITITILLREVLYQTVIARNHPCHKMPWIDSNSNNNRWQLHNHHLNPLCHRSNLNIIRKSNL